MTCLLRQSSGGSLPVAHPVAFWHGQALFVSMGVRAFASLVASAVLSLDPGGAASSVTTFLSSSLHARVLHRGMRRSCVILTPFMCSVD